MAEEAQPPSLPGPGVGLIAGGISIIVGWAALHVILFYLFAGGGILMEIMVKLVGLFLFPGSHYQPEVGEEGMLAWTRILVAGCSVAGAAGIPLGLALCWRSRRKLLLRSFWIALVLGFVVELYAVWTFITDAFSSHS